MNQHRTIYRAIYPLAFVFFGLVLAACDSAAINTSPQPQPEPSSPDLSKLEVSASDDDELIFSSVKGLSSDIQHLTLKNIGDAPLDLETLSLTGSDAVAFTLTAPALPQTIAPGGELEAAITFAPGSAGSKSAQVNIISSNAQAADIGLYGLGTEGEQGENEPPLQQVFDTLGYSADVGGTDLVLGDSEEAIGDEILAPLFEKAGTGPVTLEVVARYGPEEDFPYGFFTLSAAQPIKQEVGVIAASEVQKLLPAQASGTTTFDPGSVPFGLYGEAGGETQYGLDGLNTGKIAHALRVYPAKDRDGTPLANTFLVGLEEASNGDYQDALFVISNVQAVQTTFTAAAAK